MLFNNSKSRLFIASFFLIGAFTSVLYCYGKVQGKPQQLGTWLKWPGSLTSIVDINVESLQETLPSINPIQPDTESTKYVVAGSSSSAADPSVKSSKVLDASITSTASLGVGTASASAENLKTQNVSIETTVAGGKGIAPFITWMESIGITSKQIPLITIADSKYTRALRNLKGRLDKWNRGSDLVVICLDLACAEEESFARYTGYTDSSGEPMKHVAMIKFELNSELAKNGFNFLFLDGDVYLTGSRDPFEDMLPLSDDTWDIQFQSDQKALPTTRVNIGWYFAKSTPATIEFFDRSYRNWTAKAMWDQEVMNNMVLVMEAEEHRLRVHRLWSPHFQNWMSNDWELMLFGNEPATAAFIEDASMIHYTCVEQNLKTYLGSNFGGLGDIDEYYSSPPPLLAVANVSGVLESIHDQVAFAAQMANATERTLIWPDSVSIIQKRVNSDGSAAKYQHVPQFPGPRAISYAAAGQAGLKIVEGRYLLNQRIESNKNPLQERLIDVTEMFSDGGPDALELHISKLHHTDVAVLDFANFTHGKWLRKFLGRGFDLNSKHDDLMFLSNEVEGEFQSMFFTTGMKNYSAPMRNKLKTCGNANEKQSGCLQVCK